jgi:membrane protease YdiL (CAAX protease family)
METKKIFLLLFFLSLLVFAASLVFGFLFGYVGAMHFAILFLALFFIYEKDLPTFLKRVGIPGNLKKNTLYVVAGLGAIFVTLMILSVVFLSLGISDHQNVVDVANALPLSVLLLAIVFAPISEEFFFRAFLTDKIGIIPSSIIFGVFHFAYGSVVEIVGAFLIGIILATAYKRSGSIIPSIAIHLIYNLIAVIFLRGLI